MRNASGAALRQYFNNHPPPRVGHPDVRHESPAMGDESKMTMDAVAELVFEQFHEEKFQAEVESFILTHFEERLGM